MMCFCICMYLSTGCKWHRPCFGVSGTCVGEKRETERKTIGLSFRMATEGKISVDRKVKGAGPET